MTIRSNRTRVRQGLEALLFVAEDPLEVRELAVAVEADEQEVEEVLVDLARSYEDETRGLAVRNVAGGWRMYTAPAAYDVVERHLLSGRSGRLTQAALETLAVVAYKQPITRQEISEIRGVNADAAVRSLAARGYVEEVGRDEGPGQAILYGTTTHLLEQLGLDSLDDLPPLTDFLPESPAPDEPALGDLSAARRRLKEARPTAADGDADEDIDDLSEALERVAQSAMAQLRRVQELEEEDPADGGTEEGGVTDTGADEHG